MKELKLTTWERTRLIRIIISINRFILQQMCDLGAVRNFLKLLDVLELTEEEKKQVSWISIGTEGQATWSRTSATHEFNVSFEDTDYELLLETITNFGGWSPSEGRLADILGKKFGL